MNKPTRNVHSLNPYCPPQPRLGYWGRLLIISLTLMLAAFVQTARASTVVYTNAFDNATNNIANNDKGIGGGFTVFSLNNNVNAYFPSASAVP